MREIFLTELTAEILGPREGTHETISSSPLNEYITGILAPLTGKAVPDIDSEAEIPVEDTEVYGEEADEGTVPLFSPVLDPKKKPPSMGLSFILESVAKPKIKVCLTWGRYTMEKNGEGNVIWRREPRRSIQDLNLDQKQPIWLDSHGENTTQDQAEISLHIIAHPEDNNRWFVSLYLVNRIRVPPKDIKKNRITAEYHIFQPQIRVSCSEGTQVIPGRKIFQAGKDRELEFLYRDRPVRARGHMCSAMWKEIDPEMIPANIEVDFSECLTRPPFLWSDGECFDEDERKLFCPADLRTEFVPVYAVLGADFEWPGEYGTAPDLRADVLAETWDPDELKSKLSPLVGGYEKWIERMEEDVNSIPEQYKEIAQNMIIKCRMVLQRMRSGLEILYSNNNARVSFCFANKAMHLQHQWMYKEKLSWHPFQLAFVLMTIESIVNPSSQHRKTCDLLWIPTGGGKTEAYLAIAAFVIGYRRRQPGIGGSYNRTGVGVSVLTRYTLRLLTIQQFRRTLGLVTACEYLRVHNIQNGNDVGWRPESCTISDNFLWGSVPFTTGLWVGGKVTPNQLGPLWVNGEIPGALGILKGKRGDGEPAQVLSCPVCGALLAISDMGLQPGEYELHFVFRVQEETRYSLEAISLLGRPFPDIQILNSTITSHQSRNYYTLTLQIKTESTLNSSNIDSFWDHIRQFYEENGCSIELAASRPSRPGYFIRHYVGRNKQKVEYDFEIFCPNPNCELHIPWFGGMPAGWICGRKPGISPSTKDAGLPRLNDDNRYVDIQEPFRLKTGYLSDRIPIPALTVDEQIYHRLPSMVLATVDKFARPPFEPKAAALFGNVQYHNCIIGYYRPDSSGQKQNRDGHPEPVGSKKERTFVSISPPAAPDLILQDELHLIEGPLGSLAGIYEVAVEFLSSEVSEIPVKYIASTATIRSADEQAQALFRRNLLIFPPPALSVNDRFFVRDREIHPLEDREPGRLYVGICAPGKGSLTPVVRIWSRLLQTAGSYRNHQDIDSFWTLTGYFNAIRELGGTMALFRQDIPQRVNEISDCPRELRDENTVELSGRISSTELPAALEILRNGSPDALFATSMLGTGVDIPRIGLMVVHGQPKTTSSYIQSTGRAGRKRGALVVTFFRASRPRDLNHFEFFCGYHRQLHRFVEPIAVYPFSPGVLERAAGPVGVFILRNMRNAPEQWHKDESAPLMKDVRRSARGVQRLPGILEMRAGAQPEKRRPRAGDIEQYVKSGLDKWQAVATRNDENLKYVEYAIYSHPKSPVVLGDYQHRYARLDMVYENAPQSLRDIEETTGFQDRG